jgi:hypothetical protein
MNTSDILITLTSFFTILITVLCALKIVNREKEELESMGNINPMYSNPLGNSFPGISDMVNMKARELADDLESMVFGGIENIAIVDNRCSYCGRRNEGREVCFSCGAVL